MATELKQLEEQISELTARIERLEGLTQPAKTASIQTFAPEAYEILQPINVLIEQDGDSFVASFLDANIGTSGETEQEAFDNLKSLILDVFDSLTQESPERLGPEPKRQFAVLRTFLRAA